MRWLLPILVCVMTSGCMERVLVVRSDPPGAVVYVDGQPRGTTSAGQPVEVPFDAYGTRTVIVRREGYVPTRRQVELKVPWYQYFPIGLVTDLLWPGTIRDEHRVELKLKRRGPPRPAKELAKDGRHFVASQEQRP